MSQIGFAKAMKDFFRFLPGETALQFGAELRALPYDAKLEFAQDLRSLGIYCADPEQRKTTTS